VAGPKYITKIVCLFLLTTAASAQIGPPDAGWGVDRLAAAVKSKDTAFAVEAVKALAEIKNSPVAFNALAGAVENKRLEAPVRLTAIRALERYGEPRAASSLMAVLGDDDVRWAAADALLHFKSDAVTAQLVNTLSRDKKSKRRAAAAYTLGRFRAAAAYEPLLAALRDGNVEVRIRACAAVAAYGDHAGVEPLIVNLKTDKDWRGRLAAVRALGLVRDDRSVRPLGAALNDKKAAVRAGSAASLAAIGDVRAMDLLRARLRKEKDAAAREAITRALADLKAAVLSEVKP